MNEFLFDIVDVSCYVMLMLVEIRFIWNNVEIIQVIINVLKVLKLILVFYLLTLSIINAFLCYCIFFLMKHVKGYGKI